MALFGVLHLMVLLNYASSMGHTSSSEYEDSEPEFIKYRGRSDMNLTNFVGTFALLPCHVRNLGEYTVTWVKGDTGTALSSGRDVLVDDPRISIVHPHPVVFYLQIVPIEVKDEGEYQCVINTEPRKVKRVYLTVLIPPPIVNEEDLPDAMTAAEGDNVTLICEVIGKPTPKVSWFYSMERNHEWRRIDGHGEQLDLRSVTAQQV